MAFRAIRGFLSGNISYEKENGLPGETIAALDSKVAFPFVRKLYGKDGFSG